MKIYSNRTGFTLTEVIIASSIVGIIMWGIISSNLSLQKSTQEYAGGYLNTLNTNNVLTKVLNDAAKAAGTPSCPGYANGASNGTSLSNSCAVLGTGAYQGNSSTAIGFIPVAIDGGDENTFCFQSVSNLDASSPTWLCYTWIPPGVSNAYNIYSCSMTSVNPAPCSAVNTLIGTAKRISPKFFINSASGSQQVLFSITIENCPNPVASSCCDPIDPSCTPDNINSYIKKSGSVSPTSHTAG